MADIDALDVAKAECESATAEMAAAFDRLTDRLLLLGDRQSAELAIGALVTVGHAMTAQNTLADAAFEFIQGLHEKELAALGSTRQDAARRLLQAAGARR